MMSKEKNLWMIKMIKILSKLYKKLLKKQWAKIENKSSGELSWTEYTDYKGNNYIIYNLIQEPGFSDAYLKKS